MPPRSAAPSTTTPLASLGAARLDAPADGAQVAGALRIAGSLDGGDGAEALLVERTGAAAVRAPLPAPRSDGTIAFELTLALGAGERGARTLTVSTIGPHGARRLLARRTIHVAPSSRAPRTDWAPLLAGAAEKAWRALREGRLPLSPRAWLTLLRHHVRESRALDEEARALAPARARAAAEASRRLEALLDGRERLSLPAHAAPAVSFIVAVHGRPELTLAALASIAAVAGEAPLEVIVVDDASDARTAALLDRLDGARLIRHAENLGFLVAVNHAAAQARGEVLALLNSDAEILPGSVARALALLRDPAAGVGVVGGRLIHPNGRLQEAGGVLFSDGGVSPLGRGRDPDDPAFDRDRDVDYVSGALLFTPRRLFLDQGRFDERFRPAYYEDVDYCVRVRQRGLRVIVARDVVARHHEFGSAASPSRALAQQAERRPRFVDKHRAWLAARPAQAPALRVVVIDDRLPLRRYGSGHPRAAALVAAMAEAGFDIVVYPILFPEPSPLAGRAELPPTVERAVGPDRPSLGALLDARELDVLFVSRAHNLEPALAALPRHRRRPAIVWDAEALASARAVSPSEARALADAERELARRADLVLVPTEPEAATLRASGAARVAVVGHALPPSPTPRPHAARAGLLFVGAFHTDDSPNAEAARLLAREVLPRVRARLGDGVWLVIAGARPTPSLLALAGDGVEVRGAVDDLTPLYDEARLFVAPHTRAAGLPYKLHEAAAHGLPIVTTPLLAAQLGWRDGHELTVAATSDAVAEAIVSLYDDAGRWRALREAALARVAVECDPRAVAARLITALREVADGRP